MKHSSIEKNVKRLTSIYKDNGLPKSESFKNALLEMTTQDDNGVWWAVSHKTGLWHYYDGENWLPRLPISRKNSLYTKYTIGLFILSVSLLLPSLLINRLTQIQAYFILDSIFSIGILGIITSIAMLYKKDWLLLISSIICMLIEIVSFIFVVYMTFAFQQSIFRLYKILASDFYFLAYSPIFATLLFIIGSIFASKLLAFYESIDPNKNKLRHKKALPFLLPLTLTILGIFPVKNYLSKNNNKNIIVFSLIIGVALVVLNITAILNMPLYFTMKAGYLFTWTWGTWIIIGQMLMFIFWSYKATVSLAKLITHKK